MKQQKFQCIANCLPKKAIMKQAGIIAGTNKFHRGNDVPFMKSKKEAKENWEQNKH